MDGGQIHDQGLVNTDPRFIYVPFHGINLIPTDIRGLTYNRSPQMNINILTLGAKDGKGGFFPKGIHGKIKTPEVRLSMQAKGSNVLFRPSCCLGVHARPCEAKITELQRSITLYYFVHKTMLNWIAGL